VSDKAFALEILTPQGRIFSGPVTSLVAPGGLGYLGVWAHHAPFVTYLVPGRLIYREPQGTVHVLRIRQGGFLEVKANTATVLAEGIGEA
jgi:F-type H+-transporting ATPase subunit epsilon